MPGTQTFKGAFSLCRFSTAPFFKGSDGVQVETEIRSAVREEFAALTRCTDQEREAYFSDLLVSEKRWIIG